MIWGEVEFHFMLRKIYDKFISTNFAKKLMLLPFIDKLLSYEILTYLIFGVLTTVVNFVIANLFGLIHKQNTLLFLIGNFRVEWEIVSQFVAWLGSVIFAFVTNKFLVFESKDRSAKGVAKEFSSFVAGRVLSYLLFELGLVTILRSFIENLNIRKVIAAVFTIVFNYVVSKFISFKNKKTDSIAE